MISETYNVAVRTIEVDGCPIVFSEQGPADAPRLILLHCGGGHAGWWSGVSARLADDFCLVIPELSGHGDSGQRQAYTPEAWAREAAAIVAATGPGPFLLVGHSMGGLVAIYVASRYPELVDRIVLVDPPIQHVWRRQTPPPSRPYDTLDEAVARFKLRPPETFAERPVLDALVRRGLRNTDSGWVWKYDPRASQRFDADEVRLELTHIACPIGCIYGGRSPYFDAGTLDFIEAATGRPPLAREIADAFHHVPLDAPRALADAVRQMHADLGRISAAG